MSQAQFAASFGFGLDAVQNWEQGRRRPEGAAGAFLKVIDREPEAVRRALAARWCGSRTRSAPTLAGCDVGLLGPGGVGHRGIGVLECKSCPGYPPRIHEPPEFRFCERCLTDLEVDIRRMTPGPHPPLTDTRSGRL